MEFDLCMVFDGVLMQDNCKPNADKDLNNIPNIYICVSDQFTKRLNSTYVTAIKISIWKPVTLKEHCYILL